MSLRGLFGSFRRSGPKPEPPAAQSHIAWVIAGLGNPEEGYRRSRHNLGFMALERLAERCGVKLDERRFKAHCGRGVIDCPDGPAGGATDLHELKRRRGGADAGLFQD